MAAAEEGSAAQACPSARAEAGNLLFGRVNGDRVERLATPLPVEQGFIDALAARGPPEQRFRFAGRCVEGACAQWQDGACGVIRRVLAERQVAAESLPACALRPACRWFGQEGAVACAACALVVTDRRTLAAAPERPG